MSRYFIVAVACVLASVTAAPPSPHSLYQRMPDHLVDYFMDNSEQLSQQLAAYTSQSQAQEKQEERQPARLENLEPDSEVELLPGAQQPQQPPQQNPVNPNVPGLVPGQRGVFIVHMPVPGLRPGTIGGYQPVYIVAAAPQGNTAYAANGIPVQGVQGIPGYQNAILVNPAGAGQVVSPYFGYPGVPQAQFQRGQYPGGQALAPGGQPLVPGGQPLAPGGQPLSPGGQAQYLGGQPQFPVGQQAGLLFGGGPLGFRGFEPLYQQQVHPGFAFQQAGQQQQQQQNEGFRGGAVHLQQLIGLQQAQQAHPANQQRSGETPQNSEPKRVGETSDSLESKEALREAHAQARNPRPSSPHTQKANNV